MAITTSSIPREIVADGITLEQADCMLKVKNKGIGYEHIRDYPSDVASGSTFPLSKTVEGGSFKRPYLVVFFYMDNTPSDATTSDDVRGYVVKFKRDGAVLKNQQTLRMGGYDRSTTAIYIYYETDYSNSHEYSIETNTADTENPYGQILIIPI